MTRLPALQLQPVSGGWRVSVKQVFYERSRGLTWSEVFASTHVSTSQLGSGPHSDNAVSEDLATPVHSNGAISTSELLAITNGLLHSEHDRSRSCFRSRRDVTRITANVRPGDQTSAHEACIANRFFS